VEGKRRPSESVTWVNQWLGDFYFHRLSIDPGNAFMDMYLTVLAIGRSLLPITAEELGNDSEGIVSVVCGGVNVAASC